MKDPRKLVGDAAAKAGDVATKALGFTGDLLDDPKKATADALRDAGKRIEDLVGDQPGRASRDPEDEPTPESP